MDPSHVLLEGNQPTSGNKFSYQSLLVALKDSEVRGYGSYPTAAMATTRTIVLQITPRMMNTVVKYLMEKGRVTEYSNRNAISKG